MSEVFLVMYHVDYEGDSVESVHLTLAGAAMKAREVAEARAYQNPLILEWNDDLPALSWNDKAVEVVRWETEQ